MIMAGELTLILVKLPFRNWQIAAVLIKISDNHWLQIYDQTKSVGICSHSGMFCRCRDRTGSMHFCGGTLQKAYILWCSKR